MRSNDLFQSSTGEYGSFDQSQTMESKKYTRKNLFLCNRDLIDLLLFLPIDLVYMKMVQLVWVLEFE